MGTFFSDTSRIACGACEDRGENVEQVTLLRQTESVRVDGARLDDLVAQLGPSGAENVVCRALEEVAVRLSHAERCHREGRSDDMRRAVRSLIAISDQIGMHALARVAADVVACVDNDDRIATAATLARLLRVGEACLGELCDTGSVTI